MTHQLHFTTCPPKTVFCPSESFNSNKVLVLTRSLGKEKKKKNQCGVRYTGSLPPVISLSETPQLSRRLSMKNVYSPKPGGYFRPDKAPGRDAHICPKCSGIPRDESTGLLWKNSPMPFKKYILQLCFIFLACNEYLVDEKGKQRHSGA